MREVACPSCGTTLEVDGRFALFVVCESCDSTVVVDEDAARIHGTMGALAPPEGVLYLGATGSLGALRFQVIGRVRYGYSRGYWNEWLLALEDGRPCWISEDEDELQLEVLSDSPDVGLSFEGTQPGARVTLDGDSYRVDEKDVAVCEGGEGQLPFPIVFGEKVPYLEMSGGDRFATVEFDPAGPRAFHGRRLERSELTLDRSREEAGVGADVVTQAVGGGAERVVLGQGETAKINCDQCGAPLEVPGAGADSHECEYCGTVLDLSLDRKPCASCEKTMPVKGAGTKSATCPHCGALNDVRSEKTQVLMALAGKNRPSVPLKVGMTGRLFGQEHEVIGHMRLVERDSWGTYTGNEFLLRRDDGETVWLVLEEGHWSYKTEVLKDRPDVDPRRLEEEDTFSWAGQTWEVDDKSEGASETIDWVEGEFTWVPRIGDKSSYMEAESPPFTILAEWSSSEMEWYRGQYLSPAQVMDAFGLKPEALSRPAAKPKPGAPSNIRMPPKRPQFWVSLLLGIACLVIGAISRVQSTRLRRLDIPLTKAIPQEHQPAVRALQAAEKKHEDLQKTILQAEVDVAQAGKLEKLADKKEASGDKYAAKHRARAGMAWSAADRSVERALAAIGRTRPTTFPTGPDGHPQFPLEELRQAVGAAEAEVARAAAALPPVPAELPPSWSVAKFEAKIKEGEEATQVEVSVPLKGDWIRLHGVVTKDPEGTGEPVIEWTDTLVGDGYRSTRKERYRFHFPSEGTYWIHLRAATGRRGSDRLAPARLGAARLEVEATVGHRSGNVAVTGAAFFFVWFFFEMLFRGFQFFWFITRSTVSAIGKLVS